MCFNQRSYFELNAAIESEVYRLTYRWIARIFRTSKGNENWFENRLARELGGKMTVFNRGEETTYWFELSGDSKIQ